MREAFLSFAAILLMCRLLLSGFDQISTLIWCHCCSLLDLKHMSRLQHLPPELQAFLSFFNLKQLGTRESLVSVQMFVPHSAFLDV